MAWSLLQTQTSSKTLSAGTTSTAAMSTTTTGSVVVVVGNTDKGATLGGITSVTCAGMTFTQVDESVEGGGAIADVQFFRAFNITGNTTPTLTVNYAAGMIGGAIIREYSGALTTDPLDKHTITKSGTANNAPNSGATATQTNTDDLVIGYAGTGDSGNTYTAGSGFTNATTLKIGTTVDMGMQDKILSGDSSAQTSIFSITNVSDWACGVATFKSNAGGAAPVYAQRNQMMGVGM